MIQIKLIAWVFFILGLVSLAIGYSQVALWQAFFLPVLLLLLWGFNLRSGSERIASIIFLFYILGSGVGIWLGSQVVCLIIGILSMITTWDLQLFIWRMESANLVVNQNIILRKHLFRLLVFAVISVSLIWITQNIHIRFSFGVAVLLSMLVILGLSIGVNLVRRSQM